MHLAVCERAEALRASAVRQVANSRSFLPRERERFVCLVSSADQAAFTIKELRGLTKLAGVSTSIEAPPDAFSAVRRAFLPGLHPRLSSSLISAEVPCTYF